MREKMKYISPGQLAGLMFIVAALAVAVMSVVMQLQTDVRPTVVKVAAVGDSNTYGATQLPRDKYSYPAQLQEMLGPSFRVTNYGVSGTTAMVTGTSSYSAQPAYDYSLGAEPHVVLLMLGTNDASLANYSDAAFRQSLTKLVDSYKALSSHPKVYVLTPPALYTARASVLTDHVIPSVREVAQATDSSVIDIYAATKNRQEIFPDGVHPTEIGYRIIVETIRDRLLQDDQ
jgi:lysophospholipase L1-like esterase